MMRRARVTRPIPVIRGACANSWEAIKESSVSSKLQAQQGGEVGVRSDVAAAAAAGGQATSLPPWCKVKTWLIT